VVVSSTENNKTATKVNVLFFPFGKTEEVAKSRLDFAEPPTDASHAQPRFLNCFFREIPDGSLPIQ
jgi:hypothetical protein